MNVIEVCRSPYSGCLIVICYRHNASMPAIDGAHWCCQWALEMFNGYFGESLTAYKVSF